MKNKYLISGVGPSHFGVGRLVQHLIPLAQSSDYKIVTRYPLSLKYLLAKKQYLQASIEIIRWLLKKITFEIETKFIRNAEVILIHPQTIGFPLFFRLIKQNRRIKHFVMDNSFFCIKSYNQIAGRECLLCLGDSQNCQTACKPFPVTYPKGENLKFVNELKNLPHQIEFFTQCQAQTGLLKKHFGADIEVQTIGMDTGEFNVDDKPMVKTTRNKKLLVYHAAIDEAKGFGYLVALSRYLTDFTILVPGSRSEAEKRFPAINFNEITNIHFEPMTWDTGLQQKIMAAAVVLCPSVWSAPVEGALLKSLVYNGNVAVYNSAYSFQSEIPDNTIIRLDENIESSANKIKHHIAQQLDYAPQSKQWLQQYFAGICLEKLFE